jgi:hypothetical protein
MRQIPVSSSLIVYLDELEYTEAALRAEPSTGDLAGAFHDAIQQWGAYFAKQRASRREVLRAEAVVGVRDAQIDTTTRKFSTVLLMEAGGDRKSTFFRRFFPVAPSEFIRQGLRDQCERTRDVIVPELEKLEGDSALSGFAKPLGDGVKAALAALTARSKAKGEAAMTNSDIDDWKEGINQLRRTTYAELMKRASEAKHPREWPEMFFRMAGGRDAEGEAEPEAGDAQAPG